MKGSVENIKRTPNKGKLQKHCLFVGGEFLSGIAMILESLKKKIESSVLSRNYLQFLEIIWTYKKMLMFKLSGITGFFDVEIIWNK